MANNDVVGKILLTQDQIWQKAKEMGDRSQPTMREKN